MKKGVMLAHNGIPIRNDMKQCTVKAIKTPGQDSYRIEVHDNRGLLYSRSGQTDIDAWRSCGSLYDPNGELMQASFLEVQAGELPNT